MAKRLIKFDVSDYLDSEEMVSEYLSQVLAGGDAEELIRAIGHIAKARGMTEIARASGLGRESLYKALAPGAKPRFDTVLRILRAMNVTLRAEGAQRHQAPKSGHSARRALV